MEKTTYHCDKCKKQVEKSEDLKHAYAGWGHMSYGSQAEQIINMALCVKCCAKIGLVKQVIKDDKIVDEPQELKDRLFDIVADLVQEIVQDTVAN